jgi:hypothetical protein
MRDMLKDRKLLYVVENESLAFRAKEAAISVQLAVLALDMSSGSVCAGLSVSIAAAAASLHSSFDVQ